MADMSEARESIDLSGAWHYRVDDGNVGLRDCYFSSGMDRSDWKTMAIPNNWYRTEVGEYHGVVWFETTFTVPADLHGSRLDLRFLAVDYIADVWLNDKYLGKHEGYFTPFEYDVTDTVRFGSDNVLVVRVDSPRDPTEYALIDTPSNLGSPMSMPYKRYMPRALTTIKGHHIDALHRPGCQTSFRGAGNTGGIWQPVELLARGDVQIEGVKIYPKIVDEDGSALIAIDLTLHNSTNQLIETEVKVTIGPKNFEDDALYERSKMVQLQPGMNTVKLVKTVPDPKLWWTWDHGFPYLYQADIVVGAGEAPYDALSQAFGIKRIEQDANGNWVLNGRRIFLRGMRYFSSLWLSEMDTVRYRKDLDMMLDLHINSIRLGSHVELPAFYDLCDEMGILVWQVFPMHFPYSDSDELIEKAAPMMKQMVSMLYNHACIGMWSVHKEPLGYPLSGPKPNNYGRLCQIMYEAAKTVDPIRWVHKGDYREGVKNVMVGYVQSGDTDIKAMGMEPNIVEFGCGAIPCLETLKTFIPEKDMWPPNWDTWEYYCLRYDLAFGRARIEVGNSVEEFISNSQSYAARAIKEQAEYLRTQKYQPVGSMYLYFWNDPCAIIGAGLLDYYRRPYQAYEVFKTIYTPVLVSLEWNQDPYLVGREKVYHPGDTFEGKLWITNDNHRVYEGACLTWRLMNVTERCTIAQDRKIVDIPLDSAQVTEHVVWAIPQSSRGTYRVEMSLDDHEGSRLSDNYFDFVVE